MSLEVTSLGVQVHGGMGFIEETGAAQYLRDARILTIYEGTTAIQANDLVGRKTLRDGGADGASAVAPADRGHRGASCASATAPPRARWPSGWRPRARAFLDVVDFVVAHAKGDPNAVFAGSVPYLMLGGNLVAGWQMARALLVAEQRLAAGERRRVHARQDRHGTLLRRPHPEPRARACATASSRARPRSPTWRSKPTEQPRHGPFRAVEGVRAGAVRDLNGCSESKLTHCRAQENQQFADQRVSSGGMLRTAGMRLLPFRQ